jgi:hypothetical protein
MRKLIITISGGLLILQLFCVSIQAAENKTQQINFSITLSGHILFGIGYSYFLTDNHAVQTTLFLIPEKGFPFGINAGYNYFWEGEKWRPNLGTEFTLLVSPPDPDKRRVLPLIKLIPGIRYDFNEIHNLNSRLWIAYFPTSKRVRVAPIGLDFKYGYNL